jgi:hypothetical protein
MARRKSDRELDREIKEIEDARRVLESGDVYSSLLPGSKDYEVVAKTVTAARANDVVKWSPPDREALRRVLAYAKGFAANQGLTPAHPRLIPSGDSRMGYVYHSLESRHANDPSVATFSNYDQARAATHIAEQTALELGVTVPGREGSRRNR